MAQQVGYGDVTHDGQDAVEDDGWRAAAFAPASDSEGADGRTQGGSGDGTSRTEASGRTVASDDESALLHMLPPEPEGSADGNEPIEKLPSIIAWVIASYYAKNYEPFFMRTTEDCSFIGAGNMSYFSREEMLGVQEAEEMTPFVIVRNARLRVLDEAEPVARRAIVYGTYDLFTGLRDEMLTAVHQRVTACCRLTDEGWKAYHIHSSNEWRELVDGETFPVQVSMDTYRYVQGILKASRRTGNGDRVMLRETNGSSRIIMPAAILYVEAAGKHSIVHELNGSYELNMLLSDVEHQLGDAFLRVHRSYLVNTDAISSVSHGKIELIGEGFVPVPERRSAEIRQEIMRRIDRTKK